METRRFGRTGHMSTVAIFGAVALASQAQEDADATLRRVIAAGVNHIDVAPSYGDSELRLGPWLARERERFFLGCKTMERSASAAAGELRRSLVRMQVDNFDLYQIHAITTQDELDEATRKGGALEAILEAREAGLTRFIGITGHGLDAPTLFLEALRRFDFDTVLFPVSFILWANPEYRERALELLQECRARDVGVMAIKTLARRPWAGRRVTYDTWYEPFDKMDAIQEAINFALSQDVTGLCSTGDARILPYFLEACRRFTPMDASAQEALVATADRHVPLWT